MPNPGDYSLGKIYKLVSNQTDDIYIYILVQRVSYIYLNGSQDTKEVTPIGKKATPIT